MGAASRENVAEALRWIKSNVDSAMARSRMMIQSGTAHRSSLRKKKERDGLPLILPSSWPPPTQERMEIIDAVMEAFRDLSLELLLLLHNIQRNLHFWRVRLQGTDLMRVRFMVMERGPRAFVEGITCMLQAWTFEGSPTQKLAYDASCRITERVTLLMKVQQEFAVLLAQVYQQVDILGKADQSRRALTATLKNVYKAMANLEKSYDVPPSGYYYDQDSLKTQAHLRICVLPEELISKSEWSDEELETVTNYLYIDLRSIKASMQALMPTYERPNKITRLWFRYTASAAAIALLSGWVFKHSRLAGSDDLENWMRQGAEAVKGFYEEHVQEPILSIKNDLFETFRKRHQGAEALGDVKLTSESLNRMLKTFAEQTSGLPPHATDNQLLEILMNRYEKELTHPITNLFNGELARALLIQVQKLKLDIETAMLELNQILRANEINFAVLAALPAFFFAVFLAYLLRISLSKGKTIEGRGRAAQMRRRMLVAEAERAVMHCQFYNNNGQEREALWQYGMVLYALDRLYRALSNNRIGKAEWFSLREDILDLAKPSIETSDKLLITARMGRLYECLAPVPTLK